MATELIVVASYGEPFVSMHTIDRSIRPIDRSMPYFFFTLIIIYTIQEISKEKREKLNKAVR